MDTTPAGRPIVDREKTAPFLIRTFVKVGTFHRLPQFEDGALPTADEQQIFTWKDATLREVLTNLRSIAPASPEYKHPLARYSFRAIFADSANRGRIAQKELGTVYSRDVLGEPGTLTSVAPRLLADDERAPGDDERTLEELRFVPGDYMCVMVQLPKNVSLAPAELAIKGSAPGAAAAAPGAAFANGWKKDTGRGDAGWSGSLGAGPGAGAGRGGGHWRGDSGAPAPVPRGGRGGRGRGDIGDRRPPPPRRDSPPRRGGWGDRDRERGRGRSESRSRSPVRRRNSRYD